MTNMQAIVARVSKAIKLTSTLMLAVAFSLAFLAVSEVDEAYANDRSEAQQTAPAPDHVIMPKELVGKWSPDEDTDQPHYIEIRYDNGNLVYYYYRMTYNLFGSGKLEDRREEFEYNHGYVALKGNHGTCDCYLTNGSRAYVSFYVNDASKGVIYMQDDGEVWHKVGKPGKWRKFLSWPTKPDCYDATTVATARGKTTTGADSGAKASVEEVRIANLKASNITDTNALLSATAYKKPGVNVKNCGIYLGYSEATMQRENIEVVPQVSNDYHGGYDFDIWYDLNEELGLTLEPHSKYYYLFYCEVGDEVYLSDVATFTTR